MKQYKNTVETTQNTVNTNTHNKYKERYRIG